MPEIKHLKALNKFKVVFLIQLVYGICYKTELLVKNWFENNLFYLTVI